MNTDKSTLARRGVPAGLLWGSLIASAALFSTGCSSSSDPAATLTNLTGTVSGPSGVALVGATVYLVPNTAIPTDPITGAGVLARTTLDIDEPLEDAVRTLGTTFTRATTGADGSYEIDEVPNGTFFLYVEPAAGDTEHFPGGSLCRESAAASAFRASTRNITMSSSPPASATYAGMTTCLTCHPDEATEKGLAHRLGFKVPGEFSGLQDGAYHPEVDEGLDYFLEGTAYTDGTPVYHYDYDSTRGFDKYKTTLTDPTGSGGIVSIILWLWKDTNTDEFKITFDNVANDGEARDLETRIVRLTYGGAVQKQRFMIEWVDGVTPANDRHGLYPLLQFQTDGDEARYDRSRRQFRDYHLDFYMNNGGTPADVSDDLIKVPDITKNISRNCIGCHAAGYEQYTDPDTNEVLAHTLEDVNGEYDIDGSGNLNDLNTGCENCHGPGSAHVASNSARYMVSPEYLSPSRANQLCGRCHNRQEGADTIGGDHPLDADGNWPDPGISRSDFIDDHVKSTVNGPKASKYWADFTHAKSHHQQYPDFIKSEHYRNGRQLVVCADCHNMHGGTGNPRALVADPNTPESTLCINCHGSDISSAADHTEDMLGVPHGAATAYCADCHMNKTAKTGSGVYGITLSAPTGGSGDATEIYFNNDVSSHVFDVPRKTNVGVVGVSPASAMPIPYTQACAVCHDATLLQDL